MVLWGVDSNRVQELEEELDSIKKAFSEYMHNSQDLENGLDQELEDMRQKLASSTSANKSLSTQLESMEPILLNLEDSLGENKKKLKQAEKERAKWENRYKQIREDFNSFRDDDDDEFYTLREENEALLGENTALREEFHDKFRDLEENSGVFDRLETARQKLEDSLGIKIRSDKKEGRARIDDANLEVLDELEAVTEQLISTQQKLWKTEDKVIEAESQLIEYEDQKKMVRVLERDLESTKAALQSSKDEARGMAQADIKYESELKNCLKITQDENTRLLEQAKEMREENDRLFKDVEKTREANVRLEEELQKLKEKPAEEPKTPDTREAEVQTTCRMDKLDSNDKVFDVPETDEVLRLTEEVEKLNHELQASEDLYRLALLENDASWREKLEQACQSSIKSGGFNLEIDVDQADDLNSDLESASEEQRLSLLASLTSDEQRLALLQNDALWKEKLHSLQALANKNDEIVRDLHQQINSVCEERDNFQNKISHLETNLQWAKKDCEIHLECLDSVQENLKVLRGERSALEQTVEQLTSQLYSSTKAITNLESESEALRAWYAEAFAGVRQIFKSAGLDEEGLHKDETIQLREMIRAVSDVIHIFKNKNKGGNERLSDELGKQILLKFLGEKQEKNTRSRDPDPDCLHFKRDFGIQELFSSNQQNLITDLFDRRDPPSEGALVSNLDCHSSAFQKLCSQLEDVTLENRLLKGKMLDNSCGTNESFIALQKQIDALKESNCNSKEMNDLKRDLQEKESDMKKCEENLNDAQIMIAALETKASRLSEALDNVKDLEGEKALLEAELEKTKTALSNSQRAEIQRKQDLQVCRAKIEASDEEIHVLSCALSDLDTTLSDLREAYKNSLTEAEALTARENDQLSKLEAFENQLKTLTRENDGLGQELDEVEKKFSLSQKSNKEKHQKIQVLEDKLTSTQQENSLLAEELLNLTSALEDAQKEYHVVVDEVEAVKKLLVEARSEAEKVGRERAVDEIRGQMERVQEQERKDMRDKLDDCLKEKTALLKELAESRRATSESLTSSNQKDKEMADIQKHAEILKESLETSTAEIRRLKENESELNLVLVKTRDDLKNTRDELEITTHALDRLRHDDVKHSFLPTVLGKYESEFKSNSNVDSNEYQGIKTQLRQMIGHLSGETTNKAEKLKLKVDLLGISTSLDNIVKENIVLQEELRRVKKYLEEVKITAKEQGKLEASKNVWIEMKDQVDSLAKENGDLLHQLKECKASLIIANDGRARAENDLGRVGQEKNSIKLEAIKFEQEVLNLALEIETIKDSHKLELKKLQATTRGNTEEKINALRNEIQSLTTENTSFKQEMTKKEALISALQSSEAKAKTELGLLLASLEERRKEGNLLETKLKEAEANLLSSKSTRAENEKAITDLTSRLETAKYEYSLLEPKVTQLEKSLDECTKDMRDELLKEKTRRKETAVELQKSKDGSANKTAALNEVIAELTKTKEENLTSWKVLETIRQLLEPIDEDLYANFGASVANGGMTSLDVKIASLVSLVQGAKKEKSDWQKKMDVELSEIKCSEISHEASDFKMEAERLKAELHEAQQSQASMKKQMKKAKKQIKRLMAKDTELCIESKDGVMGKATFFKSVNKSAEENTSNSRKEEIKNGTTDIERKKKLNATAAAAEGSSDDGNIISC